MPVKSSNSSPGGGVSVYSSDNLVDWDAHGLALGMYLYNEEAEKLWTEFTNVM